jgi:predicted dehydrogenase
MTAPMRVGVIGCGIIAERYVEDAAAFERWQPVACADLDPVLTESFAAEHGLRPSSVDRLIADPEIELVLNLTPPKVHAPVVRAALAAGKHVYTEKPLAATSAEGRELVADAERRELRLGCAPDTFLGSAYETGRRLIEEGAIGQPLGAAATMLVGGPDGWHPNAEMFFRAGGGPLLDIAPYYLTATVSLLGPIARVAGFSETPTPERVLGAGPRAGEVIAVEVPTHAAAVLQLEGGGLVTLTVSFEARDQYLSGLVVYGTEGSLVLPDANAFGGDVILRRGRDAGEQVAYDSRGPQETRGLGIDELVESLRAGRPHRASGALALHVLEAAEAVERGGGELRIAAAGSADQPSRIRTASARAAPSRSRAPRAGRG